MLKTSGFPGGAVLHHLTEMPEAERLRLHGQGHVSPTDPVTSGARLTATLRFVIGATSIPAGGKLRVVWTWPLDWANLQTDDPEGECYLDVATDRPGVKLKATYSFRGDLIPWNHQMEMEVVEGCLEAGDHADFICGAGQSPELCWRAPTFALPEAEFLFLINPEGLDQWLQLPRVPSIPILAGKPTRAVVVAPSEGIPGEDLLATVRLEDAWGNPVRTDDVEPLLTLTSDSDQVAAGQTSSGPASIRLRPANGQPAYHFDVAFDTLGSYTLQTTLPGTEIEATSNPIRIDSQFPRHRLFWGDVHAGQGELGCGIGSIPHHFDFARHVAGLQFATHQANDHHITLDMWQMMREQSWTANEDGAFVAWLGCEWSAETPPGGDRNVIYHDDDPRLRRSGRFFTEDVADPEPDLETATEFLAAMKHENVLINMHAGGRPTNLDFHEPKIERLAEIHSTHGTSEWFFLDALSRGYRVGITAGSDGVVGRPGADHPGSRLIRNVRSGVTAVYAEELTQESVYDALRARRTYATTGERMLLNVTVDGQAMGSEFDTAGEPLIELSVEGTQAIERVDLLCGTEVLSSWNIAQPGTGDQIRLLWGGTESCGSAPAQRAFWDGELRLRGGSVSHFETVGFCSPNDTVKLLDASHLQWTSVTAGNRMGLILDLQTDGDTVGSFRSGPVTFGFGLNQISRAPLVVDAGGVSRHVTLSRAPDPDGPRRVELSFRDTRQATGSCPYWVRVVQIDQHQAWSSPVYVTRS
ncbi:MAG: DUF3604 domain-containing protein [Gemmatimonadetes bacterium]|jgi:hypothetical protein|nr:DUF3604 domain-containing protein [Gemmatimonadota bacterium]